VLILTILYDILCKIDPIHLNECIWRHYKPESVTLVSLGEDVINRMFPKNI